MKNKAKKAASKVMREKAEDALTELKNCPNGMRRLVKGLKTEGIVKHWMGGAARGWMGRLGLGRRSTSPVFAEPLGDLSLVCQVVSLHAEGGGFWGSHT